MLEKDKSESTALNDFLKGIYMGIDEFKKLEKKSTSPKLKEVYGKIIFLYDTHREKIAQRVGSLGEELPVTGVGVIGKASEFFQNLKTITVDTDEEILTESIKAYKTGIIMMKRFINENKQFLDENSNSLVNKIIRENEDIAPSLYELQL